MKTLLTSLLLFVGVAAFANHENNTNPSETEKSGSVKAVAGVAAKKENNVAKYKPEPRQKPAAHKPPCTTAVDARFGIGDAFVEFVNKSNLKLVKYLLTD